MSTNTPPNNKKKMGAPLAHAENSQNSAKAHHSIVKGIINQEGPINMNDFLSGLPSQMTFSSGDNCCVIWLSMVMINKNFLFPQNMVRADEMNGFFGGLYRCGSAAFGDGLKTVRANSIVLHTVRNCKSPEPAASGWAASSYCNLGANENSRFRLGKENF